MKTTVVAQSPVKVHPAQQKAAGSKPTTPHVIPSKESVSGAEIWPFFISKVSLLPTYIEGRISEIISQNKVLESQDTIRKLLTSVSLKDIDALHGIAELLQSHAATIPLWFELLEHSVQSKIASADQSGIVTGQDTDAKTKLGQEIGKLISFTRPGSVALLTQIQPVSEKISHHAFGFKEHVAFNAGFVAFIFPSADQKKAFGTIHDHDIHLGVTVSLTAGNLEERFSKNEKSSSQEVTLSQEIHQHPGLIALDLGGEDGIVHRISGGDDAFRLHFYIGPKYKIQWTGDAVTSVNPNLITTYYLKPPVPAS